MYIGGEEMINYILIGIMIICVLILNAIGILSILNKLEIKWAVNLHERYLED